jgi:gluconolactonase
LTDLGQDEGDDMTAFPRLTVLLLGGVLTITACGATEPDPMPEETPPAAAADTGDGTILRVDPRFDALVPDDARIEKIADGFIFTEGPVWIRSDSRLLFSDVRGNTIYQWTEADGTSDFLDPVFEGDRTGLAMVSSNGLTLDTEGRLVICEHGNRVVSRLEADGTRTTLADTYEGRRLNSPNDAVYASDGTLYFTDPPYGLEGNEDSPIRELDYNGIFRLSPDGELTLLYRDQSRPNGITLSPDETILYTANSDPDAKVWMAYDLDPDGVSNPRVFYDMNDQTAEGMPDGMKVDVAGNIFGTASLPPTWDGVRTGTPSS